MDLQFTPFSIRKLEREMRCTLPEIVGIMTMDTLFNLVSAGKDGLHEKEVSKILEEEFSKGKDVMELFIEIIKVLEDSGFLAKALKLSVLLPKKLNEMMEKEFKTVE